MSDDARVLETLEKVMARLDAIERKLDLVETVHKQGPIVVDAVATTAGVYLRDAQSRGIDVVARGQRAVALAEKVSAPEAMEAAERLLERTEMLDLLLQGADAMKTLVDAGAMDDATIDFAARATAALRDTKQGPIESVGAFGALFKLSDPGVQRAMGFSLALAKRLGQLLGESTALTRG